MSKFQPGDEVRVVRPIKIKIPDGATVETGSIGVVTRVMHPPLELAVVQFECLGWGSIIVGLDQIELTAQENYKQQLFIARQELYRLTKAHAAELQRLKNHIAQLIEQKRQAVIALGFEDPDKDYR